MHFSCSKPKSLLHVRLRQPESLAFRITDIFLYLGHAARMIARFHLPTTRSVKSEIFSVYLVDQTRAARRALDLLPRGEQI